jgi:acetyl esterase/lipase
MKYYIIVFLFMLETSVGFGQNDIIPLWEGAIPNSQKSDEKEMYPDRDVYYISQVQTPTLEVFKSERKQSIGKAVVICPGGGYHGVAYHWEGTDIAKWFNSKGITAFVLKYRMPNSASVKVSYEAPLQDAQRALRYVRYNAEKYGLDKDQIGIMGFSAGGHLAATLGTQFEMKNNFKETALDKISARPDFMVLVYPVVTMKEDYTHKGSRNSLLGKNPSKKLIEQYSNELHVTENTAPAFIVHAGDDKVVPVENSLQLYKKLIDKGVPTEMHIYPYGGHGFSLAIGKGRLQSWIDRLGEWLEE